MNKTEITQMLELVSAVDGRKITEITVQAWLMPLQDVPFSDAITALNLCRKDASITWIEPKHIYSKAKELRARRAVEQEAEERRKEPHTGVPCPHCKHNVAIVKCAECCRVMSDSSNPDRTFFELTGVRV